MPKPTGVPEAGDRGNAGSQAERVVDAIRQSIMTGAVLPGQELRQAALAAELGTSRVPVREALQLLVAEGLVRHSPRHGFRVTRLSGAELAEIYLMRQVLETAVLERLKPFSKEAVAELSSCVEQQKALLDEPNVGDFQRLNRRFHMGILRASGLDFVVSELERIWTVSEPYRIAWAQSPTNRRRAVAEHEQMLAALKEKHTGKLIHLWDLHRTHAHGEQNLHPL